MFSFKHGYTHSSLFLNVSHWIEMNFRSDTFMLNYIRYNKLKKISFDKKIFGYSRVGTHYLTVVKEEPIFLHFHISE